MTSLRLTLIATFYLFVVVNGAAKIILSEKKISSSSLDVVVSWPGVQTESNTWLALFSPPSASPTEFLDWRYIYEMDSLKIHLINFRQDYEIRIFRDNFEWDRPSRDDRYDVVDEVPAGAYSLIAKSDVIQVDTSIALHGHLSLTGKPDEMKISWNCAISGGHSVEYGSSVTSLVNSARAETHTYTASSMCNAPANETSPTKFINPGHFFDAVMRDLKIGETVYYQYGGVSKSPIYNFKVPDQSANKFLIYGDMGTASVFYDDSGTGLVMNELEKEKDVNLVWHVGDISYAWSRGYIWERFMTQILPLATVAPYQVMVGNHEYDHVTGQANDPSGNVNFRPAWGNFGTDSHGECGVPTTQRFSGPDNGNKIFWYSFDMGLVHFISLSSEHDTAPLSLQYTWLEDNLKSVDRTVTPWLLVAFHRPLYNSQDFHPDFYVGIHRRAWLEDLLFTYNVDMVLAGHYHSYERTCAVYKQECRDDGIVHITTGQAGFGSEVENFIGEEWSRFSSSYDWGYGRITIDGGKTLTFEQVLVGGEVVDMVVLERGEGLKNNVIEPRAGAFWIFLVFCMMLTSISAAAYTSYKKRQEGVTKKGDKPATGPYARINVESVELSRELSLSE